MPSNEKQPNQSVEEQEGKQLWEPLKLTYLGKVDEILQATPGKTVRGGDATDTRKGHGSN